MEKKDRVKAVLRLLDRKQWNHSWRFPRTAGGDYDIDSRDGLAIIRDQAQEAEREAAYLFLLAKNARKAIGDEDDE